MSPLYYSMTNARRGKNDNPAISVAGKPPFLVLTRPGEFDRFDFDWAIQA